MHLMSVTSGPRRMWQEKRYLTPHIFHEVIPAARPRLQLVLYPKLICGQDVTTHYPNSRLEVATALPTCISEITVLRRCGFSSGMDHIATSTQRPMWNAGAEHSLHIPLCRESLLSLVNLLVIYIKSPKHCLSCWPSAD